MGACPRHAREDLESQKSDREGSVEGETQRLAEMEKEAKDRHMAKILYRDKGQTFAKFVSPGERIIDSRGRKYFIGEHGELRRMK